MADKDHDQQPQAVSAGEQERPIGERLKRAREAKGMSLEDVASRTRIPIRHLHSIEAGDWDALPAVTYSVGFARSYANAVGLDGAAIGRELRDQLGSPRPAISIPQYYEPADPARVPPRSLAIIAAILAILIVAGYLIWRAGIGGGEEAPDEPAAVEVTVPEAQPTQPRPLTPDAVANQPVTLAATEEVWLRIDSAGSGSSLFQGILQAGERYQVPAAAQRPVIRTGRPQVLRVQIGGRDLGPLEPVERTISDVSLAPEDLVARMGNAPAAAPATQPAG